MDILKFIEEIKKTSPYRENLPVRILIDEYSDELNTVGMFEGDEAVNNAQTLRIIKEFKEKLAILIQNLSTMDSVPPPAIEPAEPAGPAPKILSPEATEKLIATLKDRNDRWTKQQQKKSGKIVFNWQTLEERLRKNPEKLWILNEMDRTGGEPEVTGFNGTTFEFIFTDCVYKLPETRTHLVYDKAAEERLRATLPADDPPTKLKGNAVDMAAAIGAKMMTGNEFLSFREKRHTHPEDWIWLATPPERKQPGYALTGSFVETINVRNTRDTSHNHYGGLRCTLRV